MGYSNSKSVSTYTFGIPTNNYVYSVHDGIYQSDAVSARWEEEKERGASVATQRNRGWWQA